MDPSQDNPTTPDSSDAHDDSGAQHPPEIEQTESAGEPAAGDADLAVSAAPSRGITERDDDDDHDRDDDDHRDDDDDDADRDHDDDDDDADRDSDDVDHDDDDDDADGDDDDWDEDADEDEDWEDVPSAEGDYDDFEDEDEDDLEEPPPKRALTDEERAAEEGVSMMELLMEEGDFLPESFERGDIVNGFVLRKDEEQLILDVGAKREGIVPSSDVSRLPKGYLDNIEVGDEIEVVVMRRPSRPEGDLLVSLSQALTRKDWEKAKEYLENGEILELDMVGYNKGGGLVGFGALQGFVPKSHLVSLSQFSDDSPVSERLGRLVGTEIPVKIIEVNRRQRRLIMSERRAVREWRATQKEELLDELKEGEVRSGTVSSVADFGVFVDLGGADGLVHVSELTYERGKHPRDVVRVGDTVDVYILSLDHDRKRIGLSMKRLQQDPWSTVEDDHYVGQIVDAEITNLTKFGAFARLPSGLEGLIHISELADLHVEHPREVVKSGRKVAVEIISIDADRQRIGLSMRRVPEHLRLPEEDADEEQTVSESAPEDGADEGSTVSEPAPEDGADEGSTVSESAPDDGTDEENTVSESALEDGAAAEAEAVTAVAEDESTAASEADEANDGTEVGVAANGDQVAEVANVAVAGVEVDDTDGAHMEEQHSEESDSEPAAAVGIMPGADTDVPDTDTPGLSGDADTDEPEGEEPSTGPGAAKAEDLPPAELMNADDEIEAALDDSETDEAS